MDSRGRTLPTVKVAKENRVRWVKHKSIDGTLLSTVDKLTSVETLGGDKSGSTLLVTVLITELDLGEGSTTTGIVDDLTDDTTDVAVTLGEIESTELGGALAVLGVSLEDTTVTLALSTNNTTHLKRGERWIRTLEKGDDG